MRSGPAPASALLRLDRNANHVVGVATGADTHWSAGAVREEFVGDATRVRELADDDPEFRAQDKAVVDRSTEVTPP